MDGLRAVYLGSGVVRHEVRRWSIALGDVDDGGDTFLARLAALTPPARYPLTRYAGVLAP